MPIPIFSKDRYWLKTNTNIFINTDANADADTDMDLANTNMIETNTDISVSVKNIGQLIYQSISILNYADMQADTVTYRAPITVRKCKI